MRELRRAIVMLLAAAAPAAAQSPDLLTFDELVWLYEQDVPAAPLQQKLDALLATPLVDNSISDAGTIPHKPVVDGSGPALRIVQWNIERGIELPAIIAAFSGANAFASIADPSRYPLDDRRSTAILRQADALRDADIVILNELDWGLKRSDYRFVAEELAAALGMNYAYGVEFVEIDPVTLGIETFSSVEEPERSELVASIQIDRERTHALHGNAILSRYRLENVRLVRFKAQGHDWYREEKRGASRLEKGKRTAAEKTFLTTISREVRRGGRMFLVAELVDDRIPGGRLTVVNAHLEAKTKPAARVAQLRELLAYVKDVDGPIVIAGDMNTTGSDSTPTSIGREVKRRLGRLITAEYWLKTGLANVTGYGLVSAGLTFFRNTSDPTVTNIPLFSANREAKFFSTLEKFRFADGSRFDFRGDRARSVGGRAGTLSNTNQRAAKGFLTTFQVDRSFTSVGKLKLDWFFVKGMTPRFGTTYKDLNYAPVQRMSDHDPISVDLPL